MAWRATWTLLPKSWNGDSLFNKSYEQGDNFHPQNIDEECGKQNCLDHRTYSNVTVYTPHSKQSTLKQ